MRLAARIVCIGLVLAGAIVAAAELALVRSVAQSWGHVLLVAPEFVYWKLGLAAAVVGVLGLVLLAVTRRQGVGMEGGQSVDEGPGARKSVSPMFAVIVIGFAVVVVLLVLFRVVGTSSDMPPPRPVDPREAAETQRRLMERRGRLLPRRQAEMREQRGLAGESESPRPAPGTPTPERGGEEGGE